MDFNYIKQDVLDIFLEEKGYVENFKKEFILFLSNVLEEEAGEEKEEGYDLVVLNFASEYISFVKDEVNKGFSIEWAKKYADHLVYEGEDKREEAIALAFETVFSFDEGQSQDDLLLFANLNNKSNYFVEYFMFLVSMKEAEGEPSVVNKSNVYSQVCENQLALGKTERFAKYYADLKAGQDLSELSCWSEAMEFEHYVERGFKEEIASRVAYEMSEYIVNHFESYEIALINRNVISHRQSIEEAMLNAI